MKTRLHADPRHIRTMMFVGEDVHRGAYTSHYQINDAAKESSFGHVKDGRIEYGFATIAESRRAFHASVDAEMDSDWRELVNDVI